MIKLLKESENVKGRPSFARAVDVRGNHNLVVSIGRNVHQLNLSSPPEPVKKRPRSWPDELIGLVADRAAETGLSVCDLNLMVAAKLSKQISDLTELTAEELGCLYDLVEKMRRPAME